MTLPVKYFAHTMQGAPQLTNDWGCMTALLDAVLVTGFNLKSIATLTRSGAVATASIDAGHGYWVGQVLTIAGADQAAYNGEVRVVSVTSNTFTFAVTGTPTTPATGSITSKVAPLGWEIAFTGTNKRAYRSPNVASNRPYLRVDDSLDAAYTTTYAKKAKVTMAQGMSDIDTFVGARAPFDPANATKNETGSGSGATAYDGWYKWYYAKVGMGNQTDSAAPGTFDRAWCLVGDDRGFYLFNESFDGGDLGGKCFTDFESYRSADGFNTILCAQAMYGTASDNPSVFGGGTTYMSSDCASAFPKTGDATGKVLMRSHLQVGENVNASFTSLNTNNGQTASGYSTGIGWPNGPDYGMLLHPVLLKETTNLRGKMPGMFWVHNDSPSFNHLDTITDVSGYPDRTFILFKVAHAANSTKYAAALAFDLTGPWW